MNQHYAFPLNTTTHNMTTSFWVDGFTKEQLKNIVEIGDRIEKQKAQIGDDTRQDVDNDIRVTDISWINPSEETNWLFEKLSFIVQKINHDYYGYDLWGFQDGLQYSVYNHSDSGHYDWHIDSFGQSQRSCRKLSFSMLLNDPLEFEGGELYVHGQEKAVLVKQQGRINFFPSFMLHKVTPVTQGVRKALVGWVAGPNFR
jgi:PKHD-type hydroxylase